MTERNWAKRTKPATEVDALFEIHNVLVDIRDVLRALAEITVERAINVDPINRPRP